MSTEEFFLEGANIARFVDFGHCALLLLSGGLLPEEVVPSHGFLASDGLTELTPLRCSVVLGVVDDVLVESLEAGVTHHPLGDLTDGFSGITGTLTDPANTSDSTHRIQELQRLVELVTLDHDRGLGMDLGSRFLPSASGT